VLPKLSAVRYRQGLLLGRVADWGFDLKEKTSFESLVRDVVTTSEIEGELLPADQVRSSVARKLGLDYGGLEAVSRDVDGVVEMVLDATQRYTDGLTNERLCAWQAALFPTGRSGLLAVQAGHYRKHGEDEPMQVVSGGFGRPKVHFQAPESDVVPNEMGKFLTGINGFLDNEDSILKAAIAHLWFLTIHPFDDGNGRVARAITDMMLARSDESKYRFYSMSAAILADKKGYYQLLEMTQKNDLEITEWLLWFLSTLEVALTSAEELMERTLVKARFWHQHTETSLNEQQKKMLNKVLDGFKGNLTSSKWAKITKVSQDTAGRDIKDLIDKKVLVPAPDGGRSTHYLLFGSTA
jgi:Fic family protein